jgi:hypothetical protein
MHEKYTFILFSAPQRHTAWDIRSEIRHLESDLLVLFCLQERSGTGRIREHACISYVGTFLSLRKGEACVPCSHPFQVTNSSLLSRAPQWHLSSDETALHLLLLGTITDLAKGKSELLIENALLRQHLIILRRQVKRPACRKADRFLLVLLARMIRTWKQALFIVQPETLLTLASGTFPLVLEAHVKG